MTVQLGDSNYDEIEYHGKCIFASLDRFFVFVVVFIVRYHTKFDISVVDSNFLSLFVNGDLSYVIDLHK